MYDTKWFQRKKYIKIDFTMRISYYIIVILVKYENYLKRSRLEKVNKKFTWQWTAKNKKFSKISFL